MMDNIEIEDVKKLIVQATKTNYDHPNGAFYRFHMATGISFNELDPKVVDRLIEITTNGLLRGDLDSRLDRNINKKMWEIINEAIPSDIIIFNKKEDPKKFRDFWKKPNVEYDGTPSDLFYAKTIPLKNFFIKMNFIWYGNYESELKECNYNDKEIKIFKELIKNTILHFIVFDDYVERMERGDSIGIIIMGIDGVKKKHRVRIGFPFFAFKSEDYITFYGIAYDNIDRNNVASENIYAIQKCMTDYLDTWYGIQLALLNPVTETVFEKKRLNPISMKKQKVGKGKTRKVIYTKKYVITAEDIDNAYEERRKNNMQCPLWYVIGHWREYKNGNKIFIKGYWKGPERNRFNDINLENVTIQTINNIIRERQVIIKND